MRAITAIFFVAIFWAQTSYAQSPLLSVRLAGVIYADDSTTNIANVHIINKRTGLGTISDTGGFFRITLLPSDTLLFKCLGFNDKQFMLPDSLYTSLLFIEVSLSGKSYLLEVIDVSALSRYNQFRYDFINMKLPENTWAKQFIIPGVTREKYQWIRPEEEYYPKQLSGGPISALYYAFSDEGESLRKYAELMNNEKGNRMIDEKYNLQLLHDFTGLSGDTLIDFRIYLNYSRNYLMNTNGYDILVDVKNQLPLFIKGYKKNDY